MTETPVGGIDLQGVIEKLKGEIADLQHIHAREVSLRDSPDPRTPDSARAWSMGAAFVTGYFLPRFNDLLSRLSLASSPETPDLRAWTKVEHLSDCRWHQTDQTGLIHKPCTCGLDAALAVPSSPDPEVIISEIHAGEDGDGPLESTDWYLSANGLSLLVNIPVGSQATFSLSAGQKHLQSGEVAVPSSSAPADSKK